MAHLFRQQQQALPSWIDRLLVGSSPSHNMRNGHRSWRRTRLPRQEKSRTSKSSAFHSHEDRPRVNWGYGERAGNTGREKIRRDCWKKTMWCKRENWLWVTVLLLFCVWAGVRLSGAARALGLLEASAKPTGYDTRSCSLELVEKVEGQKQSRQRCESCDGRTRMV